MRAWSLDRGKPPASLSDLVPAYLSVVPLDPFSGKPLLYRPGPPAPLIYSVGPNGTDDGGRVGEGSRAFREGDVVLDMKSWARR